ncbi:low molecular weight phosphotyrosine protein phosphatase [Kaistella sp. DKR-2]|uniref:low molecular weight protein-tyrosine-phosphatase n=1 Tax=Kaistella soli TaxID=2849654 RepID=UPI001C255D85|nr:low molecular weight protein-tyrosine-phosphatase [Kaistella soli]MBU8882967.1 low molecular weight phosphotyrosine protein phosphatase [Kaistella soli]
MKILVVCLGNICRSPLAAGILKSKLPESFIIDSAGTISQHEGEHPDKRAIATAKSNGIDISKQRSRPISKKDFEEFDKIYCMDVSVYEDVISMAKNDEQRSKVSLFLEEAEIPVNNYEVFDPYWSEMDGFEEVYQLLNDASEKIKTKLLTPNS